MEQNDNIIVLKDEDGSEVEFEMIMKFDIEDKEYVILAPISDDETEAVAFRIEKDSNNESLFVTIDDDDEFAMVSEAYEALSLDDDKRLN